MTPTLYGYAAIVFIALIHRSHPAMVLPRPPSSPSYIRFIDRGTADRNVNAGKAAQHFWHHPTLDRTDPNDYSLVEIELQSPDQVDAGSLQNIVHAMMEESEQQRNDSYPNPTVIPHSIFGVRDIGVTPSGKRHLVQHEKSVPGSPPKYSNFDEKLYYLKSSRPKVFLNLRGRSGSLRKDATVKAPPDQSPVEVLRVKASSQHPRTNRKCRNDRTVAPAEGPDGRDRSKHLSHKTFPRNEGKKVDRLAIAYGLDDSSTTENSMVTSSELPKQIPAPPWKRSTRNLLAQTTPVQRYALGRIDIVSGYGGFLNV